MSFFPYVISYMIAGIFLSKLELNRKSLFISLVLFFVSIIIFVLSMYIKYLYISEISYELDNLQCIPIVLSSMSIFYIIRYIFEKIRLKKFLEKIISNLSLVTFGVYLFHWNIFNMLHKLTFIRTMLISSPYFGKFILMFLTFVLCALLTYVLRKIPFIKMFL